MTEREYNQLLADNDTSVLFTEQQLADLHRYFGVIERVDPCGEAWQAMHEAVRLYPSRLLKQLAQAQVKWLSPLANLELLRRGEPPL